jgi:hypothetical protein
MPDKMSPAHRKRHEQLHEALSELYDDFITQTKQYPYQTSLLEFFELSRRQQTQGETENE